MATATEVEQILMVDGILKHGGLRELLTDRDRAFLSRVVSEIVLRLCVIARNPTTACHLQTNGITERLKRTVTNMFPMHVAASHTDWDTASHLSRLHTTPLVI